MSRFALASALVLSLFSSVALADEMYVPNQAPHFSRAPSEMDLPDPGLVAPERRLDRDTVRAALVAQRATNLAAFRAYRKAAVFPNNTYQGKIINVWRDDAGHLCAVANLVNLSGDAALVTRVAEQNNFIRLGTVTTGPLMDWILTSGFTQDEIARIQLPDSPVTRGPRPHPIERPLPIDGNLRAAETARLAKGFAQVDAQLVKDQKASIEAAVTRLMKKPQLAWQLIDKV